MTIISPENASAVLYKFGFSDESQDAPPTFTGALIEAINKANRLDRRKLFTFYPGLVAAVQMIKTDRSGVDKLRKIAGRK